MEMILSDLQAAFSDVLSADMVTGLLPLVVVAVAQGLRASGIGDLVGKALTGLFAYGGLHMVMLGALSDAPTQLSTWTGTLLDGWDNMMATSVEEILGYWLFLLAGSSLTFAVRSIFRR